MLLVRAYVASLDRGIVELIKVVEHGDAVAQPQQAIGKVAADEAGSASDENLSLFLFGHVFDQLLSRLMIAEPPNDNTGDGLAL